MTTKLVQLFFLSFIPLLGSVSAISQSHPDNYYLGIEAAYLTYEVDEDIGIAEAFTENLQLRHHGYAFGLIGGFRLNEMVSLESGFLYKRKGSLRYDKHTLNIPFNFKVYYLQTLFVRPFFVLGLNNHFSRGNLDGFNKSMPYELGLQYGAGMKVRLSPDQFVEVFVRGGRGITKKVYQNLSSPGGARYGERYYSATFEMGANFQW